MTTTTVIQTDESCFDEFKPGHASRFIDYYAKEFGWTTEYTQRVTRDAIRFLILCAAPLPEESIQARESRVMVSSPIVDKIVDAIFLDSPLLVWLERNIFHSRMLHVPYYAHSVNSVAISSMRYDFTVALMRAAGCTIDNEIWPEQLPANYKTCTNRNDLLDCEVQRLNVS